MIKLTKKKHYLIVIAYIFCTLFLLNGSFLAYCNGYDPTLELIQKFGTWVNASLWQSSKVFVTYAIADAAWNIHYVGPRILRSVFIVKWADKLNGLFGFSTKGELENYISQQTYTPLYKDFNNFVYSNMGVPLYNLSAPMFGFKPKKLSEIYKIPEPIVVEVPIETIKTETKNIFVEKHSEDVLILTNSINKLGHIIQQESLKQANLKTDNELLCELQKISSLEEIPMYPIEKLRESFLEYKFSHLQFNNEPTLMHIEYIQFFKDSRAVKIKFDSNSPLNDFVLMNTDSFSQLFPVLFELGDHKATTSSRGKNIFFCPIYDETVHFGLLTFYKYNPSASVFREMDVQYQFYKKTLLDYGYELPSAKGYNALEMMQNYQLKQIPMLHEEILSLTNEIRDVYTLGLRKDNPQDDILDDSGVSLDNEPLHDASMVEVPTVSQTVGAAAAIGGVTLLSNPDVLVVLAYLLTNEALLPLLHNPEVTQALVHLYINNGIELPYYLQHVEYDPNASISDSISNISTSTPTALETIYTFLPSWKTVLIGTTLVGAIGLACYLYKNGLDGNTVLDTQKTYEELLRSRYTNFK